jgi:hypothetical protein
MYDQGVLPQLVAEALEILEAKVRTPEDMARLVELAQELQRLLPTTE